MDHIRAIAFDADDTLWHTESRFQEVQAQLSEILEHYASHDEVQARLHETEVRNIRLFGYGVKGFTLSMIEAAIEISGRQITAGEIHQVAMMGKALLDQPLELMDGVEATLAALGAHYPLYLITKGDVLDQRNKIEKSGLEGHFERTMVVQEKDARTYAELFAEFAVPAPAMVMVGNSIKSDILPVLTLGATAVHIPYHVTASFERHDGEVAGDNYHRLDRFGELAGLFGL